MFLICALILFPVTFVLVLISKRLDVFLAADVRRGFNCLYGRLNVVSVPLVGLQLVVIRRLRLLLVQVVAVIGR